MRKRIPPELRPVPSPLKECMKYDKSFRLIII